MPELPEVETVRRGLVPVLEGRRIAEAAQRRPDLRWPLPDRFAARLTGRRVVRLGRRSKYILAELGPADGPAETLILHLGMSGRLIIEHPEDGETRPGAFALAVDRDAKHDHVVLRMADGARIVFNDPRRFGAMDLWPTADLEAHRLLRAIGPEPLGNAFSGAHLAARFAGRTTTAKAALLDQRNVAGLGNIYVCEALHRAGISPKRRAGSIGRGRIEGLALAIRETLTEAIAAGGSSLRDYRRADGELGYFQHSFAVYGREGEACRRDRCRGVVRRIVQTGRSSFYCPACQR